MGKHYDDVDDVKLEKEVKEEKTVENSTNNDLNAKVDSLAKICKSETARIEGKIDSTAEALAETVKSVNETDSKVNATAEALAELDKYAHGAFQGANELDKRISDAIKRVETVEKQVANQATKQVHPEKVAECLAAQKELVKLLVEMQGKIEEMDEQIAILSNRPAPSDLSGIISKLDELEKKIAEVSDREIKVDATPFRNEIKGIKERVDNLCQEAPKVPSKDEIETMIHKAVLEYIKSMQPVQPVQQTQVQVQPVQPQPQPQPQAKPTLYQRANPVEPDPVGIKSFFEYENEKVVIRQEEEELTLELANTVEHGKKAEHLEATERKAFWVDEAGKPVREVTASELVNLGLIQKK